MSNTPLWMKIGPGPQHGFEIDNVRIQDIENAESGGVLITRLFTGMDIGLSYRANRWRVTEELHGFIHTVYLRGFSMKPKSGFMGVDAIRNPGNARMTRERFPQMSEEEVEFWKPWTGKNYKMGKPGIYFAKEHMYYINEPWDFALDKHCGPPEIKRVTFHSRLVRALDEGGVPFDPIKHDGSDSHVRVPIEHMDQAMKAVKETLEIEQKEVRKRVETGDFETPEWR